MFRATLFCASLGAGVLIVVGMIAVFFRFSPDEGAWRFFVGYGIALCATIIGDFTRL